MAAGVFLTRSVYDGPSDELALATLDGGVLDAEHFLVFWDLDWHRTETMRNPSFSRMAGPRSSEVSSVRVLFRCVSLVKLTGHGFPSHLSGR